MRHLLALITCHTRQAYANAQRETWIPKIPAGLDYKFFLGPSESTPGPDEVFLDCDDSYVGLPSKVRAACKWALDHGYDTGTKIDDDVVLKPTDFLNSLSNPKDFSGHTNFDGGVVKAPWGFIYTLSKRAMDIVVTSELPPNNNDEVWVANTLAYNGILLHHEPRYVLHRGKRSDFIVPAKRPLRAPKPRVDFSHMDVTDPRNGIAYCVFLHWFGYHSTPDSVNIAEYHKLFKEMQ